MKHLYLLGSSRVNGNAEQLARAAAPDGADITWLRLDDHPLPPFEDLRHSSGYGDPTGTSKFLLEATLAADHIVFVTPIYWYSVSTPLKRYLDEYSAWLRASGANFRARMAEKQFSAILVSSGDAEHAEPAVKTLAYTAWYFDAQWRGHVLGNGSKPSEVLSDTAALEASRVLLRGLD